MATKAKTISTRAIAIAAVGAVALGGVQATAPSGSVLAAGVQTANAVSEDAVIPAENVKFDNFYNKETGQTLNKWLGDSELNNDDAFFTDATNYGKFQVTIPAGTEPGTKIGLRIIGEDKTSFIFASNLTSTVGGKEVLKGSLGENYVMVLTVQEGITDYVEDVTVDVEVPVSFSRGRSEEPEHIGPGTYQVGVIEYDKSGNAVTQFNGGDVSAFQGRTITTSLRYDYDTRKFWGTGSEYRFTSQAEFADTSNPDVKELLIDLTFPTYIASGENKTGAPNYRATVYPHDGVDGVWSMNKNVTLTVSGSETAKATKSFDDQGRLVVDVTGVSDGEQVKVTLGNASYVPNNVAARYAAKTRPVMPVDGDVAWVNGEERTTYPSFIGGRSITTAGNAVGETDAALRKYEAVVAGTVNGKPTSLENPAPIAGTDADLEFYIENTGNVPLVAPTVTLPDGTEKTLTDVSINPGETQRVSVPVSVPENAGLVNAKVSFPSIKDPYNVKFYVGDPANAPEKTIKDNGDGTVTIQTPDGPVTLPTNEAVEEIKKDLDDAEDKVKDLQEQLDEEKKKSDANRDKIAELTTELEKAKTDLENTKDALKRAQDAAEAAQDAANNAQETANQALEDLAKERERVNDLTERADKAEKDLKDARERVAALEKENDAQQEQIDQARKDVKDLQGKTKKLRTDLEAAKKRVSTLEEQNKKQQGQIDALVKENKTQQSQIDALKKQNKGQQKQIDGLKAGLRDANKKITALETDLALTKIELAEVSGRLAEVEDRLNTGLGKCVGTIGGSLAALVPAVLLASQFTGGTNIPQVDNSVAQFQRQLGMFNPQLAQVIDQNRGAIAAGLAGLGLLSLVLLPGTCGDASLGEAVVEPLSSARAERKAARENGEGGSSLKVGADVADDVAAGEGATGSSEQNQ